MTNESASLLDHSVIQSFLRHSTFVLRDFSALHLPVFDECVWNLLQKTRGPLENVAISSAQTHLRISEIQFVAGARDGYIKQTPFFLEGITRIERAIAWKHSVSQPDHEYCVKLKALRLVH